jgi:hypothetical protein
MAAELEEAARQYATGAFTSTTETDLQMGLPFLFERIARA